MYVRGDRSHAVAERREARDSVPEQAPIGGQRGNEPAHRPAGMPFFLTFELPIVASGN